LRALALAAVVIIHAGAWLTVPGAPPNAGAIAALVAVARFSVPAFVFVSGFTLMHQYSGRDLSCSFFLAKRFRRIALPWLAGVAVFGMVARWQGVIATSSSLIDWLASGPGHLYFLVLLAQLYLIFPLLPRRSGSLAMVALAALALQLSCGWALTYLTPPPGAPAWFAQYMAPETFVLWIGYFVLGALAGLSSVRILRLSQLWPLALAAALGMSALLLWEGTMVRPDDTHQGMYGFFWLSRLPMTVTWILLIAWLAHQLVQRIPAILAVTRSLSQHGLGIYVFHQIVLVFIGPPTNFLPTAPRFLLLWGATIVTTTLGVELATKTRFGRLLVGEEAQPTRAAAQRRPARRHVPIIRHGTPASHAPS